MDLKPFLIWILVLALLFSVVYLIIGVVDSFPEENAQKLSIHIEIDNSWGIGEVLFLETQFRSLKEFLQKLNVESEFVKTIHGYTLEIKGKDEILKLMNLF